MDGTFIREPARRSVQKYGKTVRLLRYNNHIFFCDKRFCSLPVFPLSYLWHFDQHNLQMEQHLAGCSEWIGNFYPRNVYRIPETLYDKLGFFGIKSTSQQTLQKFSNVRLWTGLFPRRVIQKHRNNNLNRQTSRLISVHFLKENYRNFFLPLWSSAPRSIY